MDDALPRPTRRAFMAAGVAAGAGLAVSASAGWSQNAMATTRFVDTPTLHVA